MMNDTFDNVDRAGSEEFVQRFVDGELSAEERVRFLSQLGRDEQLRRRAIELEQLALDASRLPRPMVPDGFAASVMSRIGDVAVAPAGPVASGFSRTDVSVWRRLADAFAAPRILQWNTANAFAVGCLAILVMVEIVTRGGAKPDAALAPAVPATLVRLVILQQGAKTVQVAGDFNGWSPARTSLEQISDGVWAVTIPLKPGRYAYMFVVDGQRWIVDPFAAEQKDDGFGSRNAVLEVKPLEQKTGAAL